MLSQIEMKYYKDVTRIADCLERIADVLQDSQEEQKRKTTAKQPTEDGGEKDE